MVNVLLKKYGIREIERERDEFIQFRTIACYSEQFHSRSRRLIYLPLVNQLPLLESCMNSKRNWKSKRQLNAISFEYTFWDHGDDKSEESTRWSSNYGSLKACALSREKKSMKRLTSNVFALNSLFSETVAIPINNCFNLRNISCKWF